MTSKTVSVRLDDDLVEDLEKESEKSPYKIPQSEIIRTALKNHLKE